MEKYDVVIVGAGPAGLKCAETLGSSGKSVLLIEKNQRIGPKVCAGGLTGKDIAYLNIPNELIEHSYSEVLVHVKGVTKHIKWDEDFAYTIDREELGQWQLKKLQAFPNIEVRTGCRISKVTPEFVLLGDEEIAYDYLVGADGSNSIVKRFLGFTNPPQGMGIQYIIPTTEFKKFEFFFDSRYFSAWYAWIFPHRKYVSIGCGGSPKILPSKELHKNFHEWLKKQKIDISNAKYEAFPMNYDFKGIEFGNIFLTGDAAGLLSSFTGEGIYQALVSGEEVAKMILTPGYASPKIPELIHKHKRHREILNKLIHARKWQNTLFVGGLFLFNFKKYREKAINLLG
jgi:geranylgeranyl reductase family protein